MDLDYFKFFVTGKKTKLMLEIERDHPTVGKFRRKEAILHAIGCPSIHFKTGWIMFLPALQELEWTNNAKVFHMNCILFSIYIMKDYKEKKIVD